MNSTSWQSKFLAKVDSSAGPGACWPWMAGRTGTGYGQFIINSRKYRAHRIAFELHAAQPIPDGMQIDHRCFNRACCNPEHLRLASPKQNGEHRRGAQANNRSGARGVSPHGHGWRAIVRHNGSALYLGRHRTIAEAAEAARLKRLELYTHNDVDRSTPPVRVRKPAMPVPSGRAPADDDTE